MKVFGYNLFLDDTFRVGVRKIILKLMFHTIIDVLILCIKDRTFFIIINCDVTHHKSFGLGPTYVNELHKRIVYIVFDITRLLESRGF